jgi:hypothetical protein
MSSAPVVREELVALPGADSVEQRPNHTGAGKLSFAVTCGDGRPPGAAPARPSRRRTPDYSTVTDFARLRGLSMSWPRCRAAW